MVTNAFLGICVFSDHEGDVLHSGDDSLWRLSSLRLADEILRRI